MRRAVRNVASAATLAVVLAACGAAGAGDGGSGDPQLSITSPQDGNTVASTFTLRWDSSVELGPPDTGLDHVHVFVDGDEGDYTVVGANEFELSGLSAGEHTIGITLQHADHSSAGAEDEVSVTVSGEGAGDGDGVGGQGSGGYSY